MKVMTFNIQHALNYKKQVIDTDLFVHAIKSHDADICCLNEVRGEGSIDGYTNQTTAFGDGLGFYRYFGEAVKVGGTSPYGNAIVSRFLFKSAETVAIPTSPEKTEDEYHEPRCVIKAISEIDGKDICLLVCHMGLSNKERIEAVKTICGLIDTTDLPIILTGDFNTTPQDPILQPIYERLTDSDEKAKKKEYLLMPHTPLKSRLIIFFTEVLNVIIPKLLQKYIQTIFRLLQNLTSYKKKEVIKTSFFHFISFPEYNLH